MAAYPGGIASFAGFTSTHTLAADNHAAQHNLEQGEIVAVQTKVGTGSSTASNNTVLRGNGAGTSAWAQVALTSDVTGVLPVANGGTAVTTTTGTPGKLVYDTSPTISGAILTSSPTLTTPTIADFTNSNHSHQNAAGGGQLAFAALLSSIFSGQVSTYSNGGSAGGTGYYINLGGIKLCWGITGTLSVSGAGFQTSTYTINMPASFFSSIQAATSALLGPAGATQFTGIGAAAAATTTSWDIYFNQYSGSNGTNVASWFIIGT